MFQPRSQGPVFISITPLRNQRWQIAACPGTRRPGQRRAETIAVVWVLQLSLCLISPAARRVFHMSPKSHNSAALCCGIALPTLIISACGTREPTWVKLHIMRHARTQTAAQSVTLSNGTGLVLHKTKKLEILDKHQNKAELCLAYNPPPPPPLIHTHPTRWPPPPYAKNYHTSFSLYPYLKHDGEELSLYMRGRLCVYPAAPAPGNKRKPPLLLVEAGKGRRLRDWWEERWLETEGARERRRKKVFEWQ